MNTAKLQKIVDLISHNEIIWKTTQEQEDILFIMFQEELKALNIGDVLSKKYLNYLTNYTENEELYMDVSELLQVIVDELSAFNSKNVKDVRIKR